jgi:hypothetical protein
MSNVTNYKEMSNAELLEQVNSLLTDDEIKTLSNMTLGLKIKLELLDDLKSQLTNANKDVMDEVIESKLANALALTKEACGSSLSLDSNGKLQVINYILSDKESNDSKNFEFMASLSNKTKNVEVMLLDASLRKVVELSKTTFSHLEPALVLEIRRRITGAKPLDDSDIEKLIIG